MPFWIDFGSVFPPNLEPKIQENRSKIDAEMASHVDLIFGSIFSRFWLPTWTLRTSFGASGLAPNGFFRIFRKPHIGCDFGANLAPFWLPKPIKIASWRRLEASWRRLGASWGRLGGVLGRLGSALGGSWDRFGGVRVSRWRGCGEDWG